MKSEALTTIEGVEIYPIISLIIFGLFFVGLGIHVFKQDKRFIDEMKNLPLDKNN